MTRHTPRSATAWLALAAAATLAAGCGGKAASASETTGNRAELRTFAANVNLRRTDLPGFKVVFTGGESRPSSLIRKVEACDGGPAEAEAGYAELSPLMQKQSVPVQTLLSGVFRLTSPSDAADYIEAANSRRGLRCLEREEIRKQASLARGARPRVEVSALREPLGAPAISGVRVWECLPDPQPCNTRKVRGFTDRLWFSEGRYVVTLSYIAITSPNEAKGNKPTALPIERRLIALLYDRASAHGQ